MRTNAMSPGDCAMANSACSKPHRGAARVQPIQVGNTVLFAQNRGGVVRDFSYEFAADAYTGKDLTIMARHFSPSLGSLQSPR